MSNGTSHNGPGLEQQVCIIILILYEVKYFSKRWKKNEKKMSTSGEARNKKVITHFHMLHVDFHVGTCHACMQCMWQPGRACEFSIKFCTSLYLNILLEIKLKVVIISLSTRCRLSIKGILTDVE